MKEQTPTEQPYSPNLVARVSNGPFTLLVLGDSYEECVEAAESYVEERMGQRFTPTYYTDLTSVTDRGVLAVIEDYSS